MLDSAILPSGKCNSGIIQQLMFEIKEAELL